jgi:hypothetical protein
MVCELLTCDAQQGWAGCLGLQNTSSSWWLRTDLERAPTSKMMSEGEATGVDPRSYRLTVAWLQTFFRSFSLNGTNFTPLDLVQPTSRRCKNVASPDNSFASRRSPDFIDHCGRSILYGSIAEGIEHMVIEALLFIAFVVIVGAAVVKAYEWRHDVLYGPYINADDWNRGLDDSHQLHPWIAPTPRTENSLASMHGHYPETHNYRPAFARTGLAAPQWPSLVIQKIYLGAARTRISSQEGGGAQGWYLEGTCTAA